ncbi:MAG: protein kinase, partial [Myxococcales bacterium]|nr:protein kinase [Myxococcales bacterium]
MATTIKDRTRLDSSPALVGTVIDKYEIVGVVGKGGMGCVYEAINTSINKRVAIKCIDGELAKNAEANARFRREALAASSVDSSHIVQIFDAGVTQSGLPYIVMELLRGRDLGAYLSEHGPLEAAEALPIVAQVLKG